MPPQTTRRPAHQLVALFLCLNLVGVIYCWSATSYFFGRANEEDVFKADIGGDIVNRQLITRSAQCAASSQSKYILIASHLRQGSDGELRLRIIAHNLSVLLSQNDIASPLTSIIIFSLDGSEEGVHHMVDKWRQGSVKGMIDDVIFVKNDAILVDTSKWMAAIYKILPDIQRTNARVMLMNDSFLLVRNVPELFDDKCGGVCGLVWTDTDSDPTRHIQSYIRSLSACEVDRFIEFYEQTKSSVHNVNELIQQFEINLGWARGTVSAVYKYAGAHPDTDKAQKVLIPHGYPAIKLKKFFVTNDSWLSEDESSRTRLPPSFSAIIYKKMNHDFNHLSKDDLKNHFAEWGKTEGRIYSAKPLVIKDWIKDELMKMGDVGESAMLIFEDYLATLNSVICTIRENDKLV